jgi:hypothetical protein
MAYKMPSQREYEIKKSVPVKLQNFFLHKQFNLIFNLSFESAISYSLSAIADKVNDIKDYTSWNLRNKVLYLETSNNRYELTRNIEDYRNEEYIFDDYESFRLSEVLDPIEKDNEYMLKNNVPLVTDQIKIIFDRLDFHEIEFGESSIKIRDFILTGLKSYKYYNIIRK